MRKTKGANLIKKAISAAAVLFVCSFCVAKAQAVNRLVPGRYSTIQAGIDAAVDGDTVIVDPNTYTSAGNRDIDFKGKKITVRSTDPNDPNVVAATIIDCNGSVSNPHRGFYFHSNEDANSVLSGFTITNGSIGSKRTGSGGGIYCLNSSPTISNCTISNNKAGEEGGGICCKDSNLKVSNCTISDNQAYYGGGITYLWDGIHLKPSVTIINCVIRGNKTECYDGHYIGYGGGIWGSGCKLNIMHSTINDNAAGWGGGICWWNGPLKIIDSTMNGNKATRSSGGGIYGSTLSSGDATLDIAQCTINNNFAMEFGGGIDWPGKLRIAESIINDNVAESGGGVGISGYAEIINCLISGNTGEMGGGIRFSGWHTGMNIVNSSIVKNTATKYGGGIFCVGGDGDIAVKNCIFWGNEAANGPGMYFIADSNTIVDFSDFQDGKDSISSDDCCEYILNWGAGNIDADPCFADPCNSNYHLLKTSPCINTGDPNYVPEPNETDLDGLPRIIGGRIDIGAYEFNHIPIADAGPDQTIYADPNNKAIVTLDGSASFDDDNDPLTYLWKWTIDGNSYDANGVNPIIELPVGQHTITLVVNDGIENSEPNDVNITVVLPLKSALQITPNVINRAGNQPRIMAMLSLAGIAKNQVDLNKPLLLYPGGIESVRTELVQNNIRGVPHTIISAPFDKDELMSAVGNGKVKLRVVGKLKTGQYFYGDDSVTVMGHR